MKIVVTIDELVLHGFDPHGRHAIADAVERELSVRIGAEAAWRPLDAARVDAGAIETSTSGSAAAAGIARAVVAAARGRGRR